MLTFGLAYPPLALVILISLFLQTLSIQLCLHFHYDEVKDNPSLYIEWQSQWMSELTLVEAVLFDCFMWYMAILFSCMFVCCFMIDMTLSSNHMLAVLLPLVLLVNTSGGMWCYHRYTANGDRMAMGLLEEVEVMNIHRGGGGGGQGQPITQGNIQLSTLHAQTSDSRSSGNKNNKNSDVCNNISNDNQCLNTSTNTTTVTASCRNNNDDVVNPMVI